MVLAIFWGGIMLDGRRKRVRKGIICNLSSHRDQAGYLEEAVRAGEG